WRAVPVRDVPQSPSDLGERVGAPVTGDRGHLGAGQGLRDPVGVGAGVVGVPPPAALPGPQVVQAGELLFTPTLVGGQEATGGLRVGPYPVDNVLACLGAGGTISGSLASTVE